MMPRFTHVLLQLALTAFAMAMVLVAIYQPTTFWIVLALAIAATAVGIYALVYTLARFLSAMVRGAGVVVKAFPRLAREWIARVRGVETAVAQTPSEDPLRAEFAADGLAGDQLEAAVARYALERRDAYVYYALCLFLGEFGAHRFYLKRYVSGTICALTFWTLIPFALLVIDLVRAPEVVRAANAQVRARIIEAAT